eukprot:188077_1
MTSSFSKSLGSAWKSTKKAASEAKKKAQERMTMEGLLAQARISLEQYLNPKVIPAEQRMSRDILRNAMGIAFITEAKGGFIVGVKGGSGVIMVKKAKPIKSKKKRKAKAPEWSAPCAVGTGGLSVGFLVGAAKVDHIIILSSQDQLDMFLSNGQLQLKGNANATAAKWGRNADAGVGVGSAKQLGSNKQSVAPIFTYSFGNKGIYGGVSLDGDVLAVRKDCNQTFYSNKVHVKDILLGDVKMPKKNKDYDTLVTMLKEYCIGNDDDEKFGMEFPVTPPRNNGGQQQNQHQIPQNEYVENNETNRAAMQSMAQNEDVQNAGRSAMKDKNTRNAAFNAYRSGGNDPNANKQLAKSLAGNKEVQGAAISVAKDEKVQKAAWQGAKKNASKKNLGKAKKMMFGKKTSDDV